MEQIFIIQGVAIIVGIFGLTASLLIIAITYFLEPFLEYWKELRRDSRRQREQDRQIEARIERLENAQKKHGTQEL